MTSKKLHVPLLQHAILDAVRESLVDGTYSPGSKLKIAEVAEDLGSSVPPVREALKVLECEGYLTHVPSRGYTVRRLSTEEMIQLNRISLLLETDVLEVGVSKLDSKRVDEMQAQYETMRDPSTEPRDRLLAHRRLHFIPFEASGLDIFVKELGRLWDQHEHYRLLFFSDDRHRQDADLGHSELIEACASGDSASAVDVLQRHRATSLAFILEVARRELDGEPTS